MIVKDLLLALGDTATLATADQAAAKPALYRQVRWVHVTDFPDPRPYLRGGEFVLTNGLWYRGAEDIERFVGAVAEADAAALGFPLYDGQVTPSELMEACDRHGVLLIVLPDVPFQDIAELVAMQLADERQAARRVLDPVAKELQSAVEHGDGLEELLAVIEREAEVPVALLMRDGRRYGRGFSNPEVTAELWKHVFRAPLPAEGAIGLEVSDGREVSAGVVARDGMGPLVGRASAVLLVDATLDSRRERIEGVCWLASSYLPIAEATSTRALDGELFEAVREGSLETLEFCSRLSFERPLVDLEKRWFIVVARIGTNADPETLEGAVRLALPGSRSRAGSLGTQTVVLLDAGEDDRSIDELAKLVVHQVGGVVADAQIGIAAISGEPLDLRALITRAVQALSIAEHEDRSWATSEETGSHRLLIGTADPEVLKSIRMATLDPLQRYDQQHNSELVRTLSVYLEHCGSWQRTASELQLHVNSLRYRISRVEQLTGRSLGSMADRVDFYLALSST